MGSLRAMARPQRPAPGQTQGRALWRDGRPGNTACIPAHLPAARARAGAPIQSDLVDRLNRIALRGHHLLYGARGSSARPLVNFLASGFPRLVRAEWRLVAAAAVLFA